MKVLLVKPPVLAGQVYNIIPPLGLGYLATALRKAGHEVELYDGINEKGSLHSAVRHIATSKPDIVGYQTFSYDVGMVREISRKVNDLAHDWPERTVQAVGGPHPSGMGPKALEHFPHIDYAIAGEGEKSFVELVDIIENNRTESGAPSLNDRLRDVPGLVYRGMSVGDYRPPVHEPDIDELGFPAWDLHPPSNYPFAPQGAIFRQFPFAPLIITRGCPFPCSFCAGHTIAGRKFRARSVKHLMEEMGMLHSTYNIREFHILDDNFSLNRDYLMEWCEAARENFPDITWCAPNGMRLDTLDPEAVRAMKASGCYYVSVGIESGSDRILKRMGKGFTVEEVKRRVAMIRREGLDVNGFFILGYPEETVEDMEATIRLSVELDLSRAAFFNFLPLPGTPIFDRLYPEGLQDGIWDSFFQYNAPFAPKGMTPLDVKKMQRKAHARFYLRPKIAWRMAREIRSIRQIFWIFKRISKVFGAGVDILKTRED